MSRYLVSIRNGPKIGRNDPVWQIGGIPEQSSDCVNTVGANGGGKCLASRSDARKGRLA